VSSRIQKANRRLTDHQKKILGRVRLISVLRAATFFLSVAIIFLWAPGEVHVLPSLPGWIVFLLLVRWHSRVKRKNQACTNRLSYYNSWRQRMDDSWFSREEVVPAEDGRAIERDLLLTGSYSLLAYLDQSRLVAGGSTLLRWMHEALDAPSAEDILSRQKRVAALSRLTVLQGRWYGHEKASGLSTPSRPGIPPSELNESSGKQSGGPEMPSARRADSSDDATNSTSEEPAALKTVPAWLAGLAGLLAAFSLGAFFSHEILGTRAYHFLSFPAQWITFGVYLLFYRSKEARARFNEILDALDQTLPLLKSLYSFRFHSSVLARERELTRNLRSELREAIFQDSLYSVFRNPLAFAMGGLIFSGPVLADWSMGGFLKRNEERIRNWLKDFAALDAMLSLAGHQRFLEPGCWPVIASNEEVSRPCVKARELHHPLLPASKSVGNDMDFLPEHRLWIITGSNMGGKSTFLRTVGMNLVLAQMGGAVRASSFTFSPAPLITSMQIQDNLARSESLFYAEVRSLKRLVDHQAPVFYFLDEMLKGTNQKDRSFACRKILSHLIESGSAGMLTTHDMELTSLTEGYGSMVQLFHFRESPGEGLQFDFKLRPGSVEGTTAITILRNEGLPV
tara:strand:+ start:15994 stop:17865 length:1872 start_codon:yes stop_codon:yes gene_type:complete